MTSDAGDRGVLPAQGGTEGQRKREGTTMNWSNIESSWDDYKASAKQQWSKLSDQQISDTLGKREQLSSKVQEVYALNKDETERQISDWQSKQMEKPAPAKN